MKRKYESPLAEIQHRRKQAAVSEATAKISALRTNSPVSLLNNQTEIKAE